MVKISIFGLKYDFWSKFRVLVKISIFGLKYDFWSKFRFLVKKWRVLVKIRIFDEDFITANFRAITSNYFSLWSRDARNLNSFCKSRKKIKLIFNKKYPIMFCFFVHFYFYHCSSTRQFTIMIISHIIFWFVWQIFQMENCSDYISYILHSTCTIRLTYSAIIHFFNWIYWRPINSKFSSYAPPGDIYFFGNWKSFNI